MLRRTSVVFGTLLLIGSAMLFGALVKAFFASGDCVSSGGSYDYSAGLCDFSQNHQFVPFYRTGSFWLAMALGVVGFRALARNVDNAAA